MSGVWRERKRINLFNAFAAAIRSGVVDSFISHFGITAYPGRLMSALDAEEGVDTALLPAEAESVEYVSMNGEILWNAAFERDPVESKILNSFSPAEDQ